MGPLRYLRLGPWRRAPFRSLRWPSLFCGVAVASLVLAVAAGSRPMFVSSAASASLAGDVEDGCRFSIGLRIDRRVALATEGEQLEHASDVLHEALGRDQAHLDEVTTILGLNGRIASADGQNSPTRVQLVSRSGFEEHVEVLDRGPGGGIWLPDTAADALGVAAGDEITVDAGGGPAPMPVSAVFADLSRGRDSHWCSLDGAIDEFQGSQPPPLALLPRPEMLDAMSRPGVARATVWWELAPKEDPWTLGEASPVMQRLRNIAESTNNGATELGQAFGSGRSSADVTGSIDHARRTAAAVESAAGPVALGTAGVALLVLLTAARTWMDRRRQEVTLLAMRGAGAGALAFKAILEMAIPLVLGGVSGLLVARWLVEVVGPGERIEAAAVTDAAVQVGIVLTVAAVVLAAAVAAAVRRIGTTAGGATSRASLLWWEPPVLALAAAALYELRGNDRLADEYSVDALLLVFPLLLLAGGAGLGARLLLHPRVSGWLASRLPVPGWLAARRLSASRLRAAAIVTGAAVAIGIVVFAGSMSSSLVATTEAKALLGPGSPQIIRIASFEGVPGDIGHDGRTTRVTRTSEEGVVRRGHPSADVLAIDPETFADAAFWDDSFADRSLASLLEDLEAPVGSDPVGVIAVGADLPDDFILTLVGAGGPTEVPVTAVGRARAFPGLGFRTARPLVVVHQDVLAAAAVNGLDEVWVADTKADVADRLAAEGIRPVFVTTAAAGTVSTRLRAQLWAVDYLDIIGPAAGVVTLAGLALYLASTVSPRRIGTAMAVRLGMRPAARVVATGLEVGAMTVAGWVLGVSLSWVAARLVFPDLDPLPKAAPAPIFRFDLSTVLVALALAVVAALLATALVERGGSRRSLPEVLRRGR